MTTTAVASGGGDGSGEQQQQQMVAPGVDGIGSASSRPMTARSGLGGSIASAKKKK